MNKRTAYRREIHARFMAGHVISLTNFYSQFPTATLTRLRAGLERDFDDACGGDPYRQPKEWLQDRLSLISTILDNRDAESPRTADEKMWDAVDGRTARSISKFNRTNK
ncbi:hypothetical protein [uncultured Spirosoma sp.]|uniref:hypothetical protein n=1 Tax=uncultured Spirosoma sp. TaxID=278208 RepID=UPI0025880DCF|nr:hypothetical protein [uncultured Spirosoma sp.]